HAEGATSFRSLARRRDILRITLAGPIGAERSRRGEASEGGPLTMLTGQFEQVAEAVTRRTASLLRTRVSTVDDRGIVLASSDSGSLGLLFEPADGGADYLRVPLRLDGQAGEV